MLHRKTRRKVLYLLVLLFILVAPLFIAYALGYSVDLSRGSVSKVGGIFIKSSTGELSIYVDGEFKKKTSLLGSGALLTGLSPDKYDLKVEKDGFKFWAKEVEVGPGLVTEIRDILLIPKTINTATSTKEEVDLFTTEEKNTVLPAGYKLARNGDFVGPSEDTGSSNVIASSIQYSGLADNKVLLVNESGFLAEFDLETKILETMGRFGFFMDERPFQFLSAAPGIFFVIDSNGGGYLVEDGKLSVTVEGKIKTARFDEESKKLMIIRKEGLEILWLEDNSHQPFQKEHSRQEVFKSGDSIKDARWFFDTNQHIIVQTSQKIYLVGIKGGETPVELWSEPVDKIFTHSSYPNKIFFQRNKRVYDIEL